MAVPERPGEPPTLGATLREARTSRGLSLATVAAGTGISKSLLSLIETGRSDITLGRLQVLCELYGMRVSELLAPPGDGAHSVDVVRAGDPPTVRSADDRSLQLLVPNAQRAMIAFLLEIEPGGEPRERIAHEGEELVHILDGVVELEVEGAQTVTLGRGDTAYYRSSRSHRVSNVGDDVARALVVATPPHL